MGDEEDDDWFAAAAAEVVNSDRAKRVAEVDALIARALEQEDQLRRERLRRQNQKSPAELAAARGQFQAVAAGLAPPHAPGYARGGYVPPPANPRQQNRDDRPGFVERQAVRDPNAAMAVILRAVRQSPDPAAAASEWLTAITTELTKIVRETQDEG